MKRANIRRLGLSLAVALLLPALALAQATSIALVVKVSGEVHWLSADGGADAALTVGRRLNDGDRVRTGGEGRAVLVFTDDRSQIKLTPDTELVLHATRAGERVDKEVELSAGTIWSKVTRQQGEFRIATPTSVASVKGTAWWTELDGPWTRIITEEGVVGLTSLASGQSVDVPMGQTGSSNGEGAGVRPTTAEDGAGLERGEIKRVTIPVLDGGQSRTLIIEYYE